MCRSGWWWEGWALLMEGSVGKEGVGGGVWDGGDGLDWIGLGV